MDISRVVIIDPALDSRMSHHHFAVLGLIEEARQLGLRVTVFSHKDYAKEKGRAASIPIFTVSPYLDPETDDPAKLQQFILQVNGGIYRELSGLQSDALQPGTLVLFPAITANMVFAVAKWMSEIPVDRSPYWALCLMFQMDWRPSGGLSGAPRAFYEQAIPAILKAHGPRVAFTCETEGLAREYQPLTGRMPIVMPIPTFQFLVKEQDGPAERDGTVISFLGYTKREKGAHLLPEIVGGVHANRPDARFLIQLMGHDKALVAGIKSGLAATGANITLIEGPIEHVEIIGHLQASDLVLLPYDPSTYRTRGSAIVTESRTIGVPMVVPAQMDMASEPMELGMAIGFEKQTAEDIVAASLRALEDLQALKDAAKAQANAARAPSQYLKRLVEAAASDEVAA